MNLHQDMEREQMRMAILKQEQIFRQQVHELHRLYHVQKQLMQQMPTTALPNRAPVIADVKPKPQLDIWHSEKATNPQQFISFSSYKAHAPSPAPAPAPSEECNLELTLATGPSSSNSCNAERQQGKRLKSSSNSDSGTTAVSSTSTDSELAQFREVDVTAARFPGESRRMDQMGQGPWMYRCLSLKTA
ncbi:hypothetical protein SEVIR_8G213200v4 [Setaria viridis]|uniref:Uncharacterized protein n=1 Tax=Setaria viridis TaxID=4556 RepID=A0A4U6THY1_SETVI|nr:uncharacterized protein LOC117866315 [Setaria viridis]TKW01960.1 hypothetical protein SEVIR_8G213200v2 [Setaria viridis]